MEKKFLDLLAGIDFEVLPFEMMINGGDGPGDADTQKYVDGVAARHVADASVGVFVVDGRDFTRECIWNAYKNVRQAAEPPGLYLIDFFWGHLTFWLPVVKKLSIFRCSNNFLCIKTEMQLRYL